MRDGIELTQGGVWALPVVRGLTSTRFRILLASMLIALGGFAHWLDHSLVAAKTKGVAPDLGAYYAAARRMLAGDSPYQAEQLTAAVDAVCAGCYLYPPVFAQALAPLTLLPAMTASTLWFAAQLVAAFMAVWLATGLGGARRSLERVAWCLVAVLWFAPLYDSLRLGNVTGTLALGATLVAFGGSLAGFGAAATALIKVAPATLVPAAFVMGRDSRRALVATMAAGLAISALLAPQAWLDYGRMLGNLLAGSVDYSWNFAPANMAAQLGLGETVEALVRLVTLSLSGLGVVASVFLARRPEGVPAAAFAAVLAMLLLPGALWFHYFGVLLPFAAMVWPTARPLARIGLLLSAVLMIPYLFMPLPGVIGAVVTVMIVGWSLWRRSRDGWEEAGSLGR